MSRIRETESTQSDEDLVRSATGGLTDSFALLYMRHYSRTYRLAYGMTANRAVAEDLTQEIFMRAFQKLAQFDFRSSFSTWFYRLGVNHCLNYRQRKISPSVQMVEEHETQPEFCQHSSVEEALFKQQLQQQIHEALLTLKPKLRLLIILKELEGLSYAEIAEKLDISPGTVASRLNRARRLLALKLAHLKGVI